jgi:Zn-dependent protease
MRSADDLVLDVNLVLGYLLIVFCVYSYFFSLSGALALLNLAPVFRMDGHHALVAAIRVRVAK